ncbi:hypothetical protein [Clostridium sp. UBA3887]|uniref:hypothetical protein n=1 Tax=Clostridium sp. UBA3887 TaxID=1946356 RepID=UPI0032172A8C
MKNIFSYNANINKNAYMNWRIDKHEYISNMIKIAEGYMKSSIILCEEMLGNNWRNDADIVIFPILFNANHAIELYLKSITWTLNILLKENRKIEGQHNIQQIFNTVKKRVDKYEETKERKRVFKELTNNLQEYIDELFGLIKTNSGKDNKDKMDFSRYPFDQNYNNHFYAETFDNVVVDLENFVQRFKEIGENLKMISEHYLYDHLLMKQEYERECEEYEREMSW